jgi:TRAP-type uncharacterized transport system fused permease subunit
MFVFYFAIISALTPPVAIGVLVAMGISGGRYLGTALNALRLALPGFLMPFFFLYKPTILNLAKDPLGTLEFNVLLLVGMFGMSIFFDGFFIRRVGWLGRGLCLAGAFLIFHPSLAYSWLGLGMLLAFGLTYFLLYPRGKIGEAEVTEQTMVAQASKEAPTPSQFKSN